MAAKRVQSTGGVCRSHGKPDPAASAAGKRPKKSPTNISAGRAFIYPESAAKN